LKAQNRKNKQYSRLVFARDDAQQPGGCLYVTFFGAIVLAIICTFSKVS